MRVERESAHTLVKSPVSGSNPMSPSPTVLPLAPSKTNSDFRNRPSLIIVCLQDPFARTGSPSRG